MATAPDHLRKNPVHVSRLRNIFQGKSEHYLAVLFMVMCVAFWGFSFISTKIVLTEIPPLSIALFRQIIASFILILWAAYSRALSRMPLRDLGLAGASGLFGMVMYFALENSGLQYTTASNASMIVAALPAFTLMAESLVYRLKISLKMVLCLGLSIAGVALVVAAGEGLDLSSSRFLGNLMILGAMACWVAYSLINRRLAGRYPSLEIVVYQSAISTFLYIPLVIPEMGRWRSLAEIDGQVMINLAFLGIFCSGLAFVLYVYASRRLGATVSSAFLNLIPVVTVISGYLLLQERVYPIQICGMVIIMAAVYKLNGLMPGYLRREPILDDSQECLGSQEDLGAEKKC